MSERERERIFIASARAFEGGFVFAIVHIHTKTRRVNDIRFELVEIVMAVVHSHTPQQQQQANLLLQKEIR